MKIIWSTKALKQREQIFFYIAQDNEDAAVKFLTLLEKANTNLKRFPYLDHIGRVQNTRALLIHKHYLLIYRVAQDQIRILDIFHTSQQYPPTK